MFIKEGDPWPPPCAGCGRPVLTIQVSLAPPGYKGPLVSWIKPDGTPA